MAPRKEQAPKAENQSPAEEEQHLSTILEEAFDAAEEAAEKEQEERFKEEVSAAAKAEADDGEEEDGLRADDEAQDGEEPAEASAEEEVEQEFNEPAPDRWPSDLKEAYNELTPRARKVFMEKLYKPMQRSHTSATQQLAEKRRMLDPIMQAYEQNKSAFDQVGVQDPATMIQQQVAWAAHFARVGPQQGLKDMQQAMGLNPQSSQDGGQESDPNKWLTPTERAIKEKQDRLEQQLSQIAASQKSQEQQAIEAQRQQKLGGAFNALKVFAEAKTPDGQPMHPHVESVAPTMSRLLQAGMVNRVDETGMAIPYEQQLGQAYQMAVNLEQRGGQPRATSNREQVAKVAAASRNVTPKSKASDIEINRPITDDIADLYDRMEGRKR